MTDKDYAPLSTSCVRALNDKLYEKRKVAALEIEREKMEMLDLKALEGLSLHGKASVILSRMVKEFMTVNNTAQIRRLLKVLGQDFALSQNPNTRKGGLIGLAAIAIALGRDASNYVNELVKPVLSCFFDSDSRVRYYGCESLYNIVKVARSSVIPFFNDIFDGLSKLAADPDQNVRSGSELLDRLMKDIVTESCAFDMVNFMPLLRERIYTKNAFARQFIVSWITTLDAVPDIDMLVFLPEILDGLFHILGDQNVEIRKMCEATLGEFLRGIGKSPGKANYAGMINILIAHSHSTDAVIQYTALVWVKEFVSLSGRDMLPFTSGILTAVLPCLAYDDKHRKNIREAAKAVNNSLMRLIGPDDDLDPPPAPQIEIDTPKTDSEQDENEANEKIETKTDANRPVQLEVPSVVQVLTRQMTHDHMQTRISALRWIYHLHIKTPNQIFRHVDDLFPLLLKTMTDPSDEVVLLDLEVFAEISSSPAGQKFPPKSISDYDLTLPSPVKDAVESSHHMNQYFTKFLVSLLRLFRTDRTLLEDRGSFIIRQLCLLLSAEDIYRCCSEILLFEEDMKFASHMIQTLSSILLTSTELFELRTQLKDLKTEESCSLFSCLYKSWCHNPVSTVALCFLSQNYKHACDLLTLFGDIEVTVEFLTEIDKLVQLLESPIFTYLRLQLLDTQHNQHLIKSLYGLLMLLPQSDAFETLRRRLECVPNIQFMPAEERGTNDKKSPASRPMLKKINFSELVNHFRTVQEKHRAVRRQPKSMDNMGSNT